MPISVTVHAGDSAQDFALEDVATVGRSLENDIVLDSPNVSRRHARILRAGQGIQVMDLGSANGTRVDGQELEPRIARAVTPGTRVSVGPYEIEIRPQGAVPAAPVGGRPLASQGYSDETNVGGATAIMTRNARLTVSTPAGTAEFPLQGAELSVGRDPSNDIAIPSDVVSRSHMRLQRVESGYQIVDIRGQNGVRLASGQRLSDGYLLQDGDQLAIANEVTLVYNDFTGGGAAAAAAAPVEERRLQTSGRAELIVGRSQGCDIRLDHPSVSLRHARLITSGADRTIEDLGSTNGTFVNGQRVPPGLMVRVTEQDAIRIGPIRLTLSTESIASRDESRDIGLDCVLVEQRVSNTINLLQQISFSIRPHEFVAVVGTSGAGKSTLLGALSGLKPATGGTILLNGTPLYENFAAFRTTLGYVPQDDILHKELPVQKALEYAAALRLPDDTSKEERKQRVEQVLKQLELDQRRDVPISRLSGGQRKRVSIGAELLTQPGLFFLDEATSGLDPGVEGRLMKLLRGLADEGHTIVLITHATKNVMLCDQVAFLARGGYLAYYGPPEEALTYFGVPDFDGIYDRLDTESTPEEWGARFSHSPQFGQFVTTRLRDDGIPIQGGMPAAPARSDRKDSRLHVRGSNPIKQLWVLARRYVDIIRRDRVNLMLLFLLAPAIGAIDLVAWPRDAFSKETGVATKAMTILFLTALFPFLVGSLSFVREIVKEAAIYTRERTVSLGIGPYVGSKVIVALMFAFYHGAAFFVLKWLALDFPGVGVEGYLQLYITSVLAVMSGVMAALVISALTSREEQAMMLAIGVIVLQVVFSGGLVNLKDLGVAGTVLGAITSTHWAYRASTSAVGLNLDGCSDPALANCGLPGLAGIQDPAARAITFKGVDTAFGPIFGADILVCWGAMLAIMAVLCVILVVLQKRKDTL